MPKRSLRITPAVPPSILDTLPTEILDKVLQTTVDRSPDAWSRQSLKIELSWVSKEWRASLLEKKKFIFRTEKGMRVMLALLKDDEVRAGVVREIEIQYERRYNNALETLNELLKLTRNVNTLSLTVFLRETVLPGEVELYSTLENLPLISFTSNYKTRNHYEILKNISNWPSIKNLKLRLDHFNFTNAINSLTFPKSITSLDLVDPNFSTPHLFLLKKLVKDSNISVLELSRTINLAENEFEDLEDLIKDIPEVIITHSKNIPKIFTKNNTIKRFRTDAVWNSSLSYLDNFIELERLTIVMSAYDIKSQLDNLERQLLNHTFARAFPIDIVYKAIFGRPSGDMNTHSVFNTARSKGIEMRFIDEWEGELDSVRSFWFE